MKFIGCFIILLLISCNSARPGTEAATSKEAVALQLSAAERIVFINFKIIHDSITNSNRVELLNKIFSEGHLKNNDGGAVRSNSYLTCILYENNVQVDTVQLQHPLYPVYEYVNEKNQMALKETKEKEAAFFVRFQLKRENAKVKIFETLNNRSRELLMIKL